MPPCFALVDCNNFYVSCERLFRPDLHGKAVAVLSNNDGCIIARSEEVKALGIQMATPVHQVMPLIKQHRVALFSSNYSLYGDLSNRVMNTLAGFTPHLEIYSIDESFLTLEPLPTQSLEEQSQAIRRTVQRHTGIPVSIGLGPTKTLAKLANKIAKQEKTTGIFNLSCPIDRAHSLKLTVVKDIWGIGSKTAKKLQALNIITAWDLAQQDPEWIRSLFTVTVARTVRELNGFTCLTLDEIPATKQQIICSKSFKGGLRDHRLLAQALSHFCLRAGEKLRIQNSLTSRITLFINTHPFAKDTPADHRSASLKLPQATQDSRVIIAQAKKLLTQLVQPGYRYHQCGIILSHFDHPTTPRQADLFTDNAHQSHARKLMKTLDTINQRFPNRLTFAASGLQTAWQAPPQWLSPHYTTQWPELAHVKCI